MKEYDYNILGEVYYWMVSRKKNVEVRILKEKSKAIKIGDIITFNNQEEQGKFVKAKVTNKIIVNNVDELLSKYDVSRMMPDHTEQELKDLMKKIYGPELEQKQIVAIEFEYLSKDNI